MSVSRPDPIVALKKRLHEGALHHGILLLGKSVPSAENAALLLAQELLSLDQETGIHPDLFHLRPTGKARIITVEKTRDKAKSSQFFSAFNLSFPLVEVGLVILFSSTQAPL